jgi:hypothetical protein
MRNCSDLPEDEKFQLQVINGNEEHKTELKCNDKEIRDALKFEIPIEAQKLIADKKTTFGFVINFPMKKICIKTKGYAKFWFNW